VYARRHGAPGSDVVIVEVIRNLEHTIAHAVALDDQDPDVAVADQVVEHLRHGTYSAASPMKRGHDSDRLLTPVGLELELAACLASSLDAGAEGGDGAAVGAAAMHACALAVVRSDRSRRRSASSTSTVRQGCSTLSTESEMQQWLTI